MNLEEITKAVESNPELQTGLINHIQNADFGKTFLNNYVSTKVEEQIGAKIGEVHGKYDIDIKALTGMEKEQGEKTYNYLKRVVGQVIGQNDTTALQTELASAKQELETLKGKGGADELLQNKLNAIQAEKEALIQRLEEAQKEKGAFESNVKVKMEIDKAMRDIKLKSGLPTFAQTHINQVMEDLIASGRITEEGLVVFVDKDGKAIKDELFRNKATVEILKEKLGKDILDEGKIQGGGGAGGGLQKDGDKVIVDLSMAKTRQEAIEILSAELVKQGVVKNSQQWATIEIDSFAKIADKNLPIR